MPPVAAARPVVLAEGVPLGLLAAGLPVAPVEVAPRGARVAALEVPRVALGAHPVAVAVVLRVPAVLAAAGSRVTRETIVRLRVGTTSRPSGTRAGTTRVSPAATRSVVSCRAVATTAARAVTTAALPVGTTVVGTTAMTVLL